MIKWAEREIEYALNDAKDAEDDLSYAYFKACCDSALKAFKSLVEDNHSGMSISITKNILIRLIESKPITEIQDSEDVWKLVSEGDDGRKCYQCKRMSSLFKDVDKNGGVSYTDLDRCVCKDMHSGVTYHNGLASKYIDENYPIEMPYYPLDKPYVVYCEDFCMNKPDAVGEYTHKALRYMLTPSGIRRELCLYYRENERGEMKKITPFEWMDDWRETFTKP